MKRILIAIVTVSSVLANVPALGGPLDIDRIKIVTMHVNRDGSPVPIEPWDFDIGVHVLEAGRLDHIHITRPGDSNPFYIMVEGKPGVWEFDSSPSGFPSLAALRALYPEGVYTFEFHSSNHKLLRTISLDYSGLSVPTSPVDFTYPSVDGQTDVSTNPTFTWTVAGGTGNSILVAVEDALTEDTAYQGIPVPMTTLSSSPGPFLPNRTYQLSVAVLNLKNWAGGGWPTTTVEGDEFDCDLRADNRNVILFTTVQMSPVAQMQQILDFVAESVGDGTLTGAGSAKPAERRLNTFISMLNESLILIQAGLFAEAYLQLEAAYQATDGQKRPNDLVTGPAASKVAGLIKNLMESL